MLPKSRSAIHPGEVLNEDFLKPMGISQNSFASHLGWSHAKVNEIIHGRRGITPEAALSLADAFKTTPDLWLNLQKNYDLSKAQKIHNKKKPIMASSSAVYNNSEHKLTAVGEPRGTYRTKSR